MERGIGAKQEIERGIKRSLLINKLRQDIEEGPSSKKYDLLSTPDEIALLFCVTTRTVSHWAKIGKLPYIRTLGGHRRFQTLFVWNAYQESQNNPEKS